MKESRIHPWNQLIDWYLEGEQSPFLIVLESIVRRHRYFYVKNFGDLMQNYDTEPEDFFQDLWLELDRLFYLRRWQAKGLSDSHLNNTILKFIRDKLIDRARKRGRSGKNIALEDEVEITLQAEVQDRLEAEEKAASKESKIIEVIKSRLNERQKIVLEEYQVFKIGQKGRKELALELKAGISTIDKDISVIRDIVEEEYIKNFPYLKKYKTSK